MQTTGCSMVTALLCFGFFTLGVGVTIFLFHIRLDKIEEKTESLKRLLNP